MATENKFEKLRSMVHQGVPLEKTMENTTPEKVKSASVDSEVTEPVSKVPDPPAKPPERRKRKPQADYQSLFFNRIDFTHRKPLYITATTHRRLMRIVHLMDES